jgi:hypothetical protein
MANKKPGTRVAVQRHFAAHGSNHSTLHHILGIFDTDTESLAFSIDMIDTLKDGKPTFDLPQHFSQNADDKKPPLKELGISNTIHLILSLTNLSNMLSTLL